jgi:hypothetical protein
MNDPVLNRAMFRPAVGPMSSYGTGIASNVASPDEAARALQTAFQPIGYAGGGQVIDGVKHFKKGGENDTSDGGSDQPLTPSTTVPQDDTVPILGGMFRVPRNPMRAKTYGGTSADPADTRTYRERYNLPPLSQFQRDVGSGLDTAGAGISAVGGKIGEVLDKIEPTPEEIRANEELKRNNSMFFGGIKSVKDPTLEGAPAAASYFGSAPAEGPGSYAEQKKLRKEYENSVNEAKAQASSGVYGSPTVSPETVRKGIAAQEATQKAAERANSLREAEAQASSGLYGSPNAKPAVDTAAAIAKRDAADAAGKKDEESGLGKRLTLRIDELKQERAANKAQQRENQLLALMQAGFAAAAGKSSSALSNIAAGGSSGIATLADLEKTRRAEDTSLRKEGLELELAKEKMIESSAERKSQREMLAAQRQQSLLQNVTVNARQEVSAINSTIANEEAKLLNPAITEDQKAPIRAEIGRLKNQRDVAAQQLYDVYAQMGLRRPMTPEQQQPAAGFSYIGPKK